jgi:hypothetical protein
MMAILFPRRRDDATGLMARTDHDVRRDPIAQVRGPITDLCGNNDRGVARYPKSRAVSAR